MHGQRTNLCCPRKAGRFLLHANARHANVRQNANGGRARLRLLKKEADQGTLHAGGAGSQVAEFYLDLVWRKQVRRAWDCSKRFRVTFYDIAESLKEKGYGSNRRPDLINKT